MSEFIAKGFTFYICFGEYAGFRITKTKILLGWVSVAFTPCDLEVTVRNLLGVSKDIHEKQGVYKRMLSCPYPHHATLAKDFYCSKCGYLEEAWVKEH